MAGALNTKPGFPKANSLSQMEGLMRGTCSFTFRSDEGSSTLTNSDTKTDTTHTFSQNSDLLS